MGSILWNTESSKGLSLSHPHKMASRSIFHHPSPIHVHLSLDPNYSIAEPCRCGLRTSHHTLKRIQSRFDYYGSKQLSRFFFFQLSAFQFLIPLWNGIDGRNCFQFSLVVVCCVVEDIFVGNALCKIPDMLLLDVFFFF